MDTMTAAVRLADEFGWRIVRLYGVAAPGVCRCSKGAACPSPGKHPIGADWGNNATNDSLRLADEVKEGDNIGLVLGPSSGGGGVIDVEYDTEIGRLMVDEALKGVECITPTFRSGRSTHRLFLWNDDYPKAAKLDRDGIEFRLGADGRAAQSVLPPSTHHTGVQYQWIEGMSPWEVEVAPLPERLAAVLINTATAGAGMSVAPPGGERINWRKKIATTLRQPGRNYALFRTACGLFSGSFNHENEEDVHAVLRIVRSINQTQCQPPLDDAECVELVRHAIAKRRKDSTSELCADSGIRIETRGDSIEFTPDSLTLTVVCSDPVEYRLHSPAWAAYTEGNTGIVSLSSEQFRHADRVADCVLEQTRVVCLDRFPDEWSTVWDGRRGSKNSPPVFGIKAKLLASARRDNRVIDAPRAAKRSVILAQVVWERVIKALPADDTDRPLASGQPKRLSDGAIWFRWEWIWLDLRRTHGFGEQEKRLMQRKLHQLFGSWPTKRRDVGGARLSFCVWGPRQLALLEEYQAGSDEAEPAAEGAAS